MASEILFEDDDGPVVLTNGCPAPGDRFRGWQPLTDPVGPLHHALGSQIPYKYTHAEREGAKFALAYIPGSSVRDCLRLIRWLKKGGVVQVYTGDSESNIYLNCYLYPGTTPELSPPDKADLKHTLTLSLLNADGEPMVCLWP